jgi:hypothetical protein
MAKPQRGAKRRRGKNRKKEDLEAEMYRKVKNIVIITVITKVMYIGFWYAIKIIG